MAALDTPHLETVSAPMLAILQHVGRQAFASRFYLAGGTALALQFGHRTSVVEQAKTLRQKWFGF